MNWQPRVGPTNGSWWRDAARENFTATCYGELERMNKSTLSMLSVTSLHEVMEQRKRKKQRMLDDGDDLGT